MRECIEDDCHAYISHKGNGAKRCDTQQKAYHASRQRDYYTRVKDAISTRRVHQRQGLSDPAPEDIGAVVVDYSNDGYQVPGEYLKFPHAQVACHHHVTRQAMQRAAQKRGEDE